MSSRLKEDPITTAWSGPAWHGDARSGSALHGMDTDVLPVKGGPTNLRG
jgi:hypothetical protein